VSAEEDRRKHLEFLQAVIARQAGNGFLIKGWALTVCAAAYGFAASQHQPAVAAVGAAAALGFWYLDAFYLRQERLFRCHYDTVASSTGGTDFSMCTDGYKSRFRSQPRAVRAANRTRWLAVLAGPTVAPFFSGLAIAGLLLAASVGAAH
jgi:hypothetical protein